MMKYHNRWYTVLDPDLQMGGGGGGGGGGVGGGEWRSSRPRENGGRGLQKVFLILFQPWGLSLV